MPTKLLMADRNQIPCLDFLKVEVKNDLQEKKNKILSLTGGSDDVFLIDGVVVQIECVREDITPEEAMESYIRSFARISY